MIFKKYQIQFAIVFLAFFAFYPVLKADFVNYDDPDYIINNPYIKQFNLQSIQKLFCGKTIDLYVPITLLSYMTEYALFGLNSKVAHSTNLLLHIINALVLLQLLYKLNIKKQSLIFSIVIFFLLHPLVTQSVCWVTERKDVLYTLFYFLASIQFLNFYNSKNNKYLLLCFLYFILSCLSKPMAVSFPIIIALYMLYKHPKFQWKNYLFLTPFLLVSVIISIILINTTETGVTAAVDYTFTQRIILIFSELGFYFFKPFMPINLHLIYFFPSSNSFFQNQSIISYALGFIGLCAIIIYLSIKQKNNTVVILMIAWIAFLLPILQIVPNTHSYVSERYFYVSIIFPLIVSFTLIELFYINVKFHLGLNIVLIIFFIPLCIKQSKVWKNSVSLFEHELKIDSNNHLALNNLGFYYNSNNNSNRSLGLLKKAVSLSPSNAMYLNNYGWALSQQQQTDSAIYYLQQSIKYSPDYTEPISNLGICYIQKRNADSALKYFEWAYRLSPNNEDVLYNLGVCYFNTNHKSEALPVFKKAKMLGNKKADKYLNQL